jgi:hypothetical protein
MSLESFVKKSKVSGLKNLIVNLQVRLALQLMGTEVGRNVFGADLWIHALENKIDKDENYIITDVRFQNEIDWIRKQKGILIEIRRGEASICGIKFALLQMTVVSIL